jgi:hypothetical protein
MTARVCWKRKKSVVMRLKGLDARDELIGSKFDGMHSVVY